MAKRSKIVKSAACITLAAAGIISLAGCKSAKPADVKEEPSSEIISTTEEVIEDYVISTGIVDIHYPVRWKELVRVDKKIENGSGSVDFYGKVGKHDEQLLFTLHFGVEGDIPLGSVEVNGKRVSLACTLTDIMFDDSWTKEEQDTICAMQEDNNFIYKFLSADKTFQK